MQENSTSEFRVVEGPEGPVLAGDGSPEGEPFVIGESVGYLVNFLAKAMARELAGRLAARGASLGQWGVLLFLWAQDGRSQGELARLVAIEDATMVRTIDRMERDGLVRRERDAQDRRRVNVFLTEEGRRLRDSLVPCAVAANEAATWALTGAELEQAKDLMRRMISALDAAPSARGKGEGDHERT